MSPGQRVGVIFGALLLAGVARQGVVHHWRLAATGGVVDCTTHEWLDDGCDMLGSCLKCEPVCAPGTEPGKQVAALTPHRCGAD